MKFFLWLIIAFSMHGISQAQVLKRCTKETPNEFVTRITPQKAQLQYFTETSDWSKNGNTLLFFYTLPKAENHDQNELAKPLLIGSVLIPAGKLKYQQTFIDSLTNYLNPKIVAIFFCNANSDQEKELAVLFSFEQDPKITKCTGMGFETFFYKKPDLTKPVKKLTRITHLGNFYGCDCTCMRNYEETAQFKTQEAVMQELKRLGY